MMTTTTTTTYEQVCEALDICFAEFRRHRMLVEAAQAAQAARRELEDQSTTATTWYSLRTKWGRLIWAYCRICNRPMVEWLADRPIPRDMMIRILEHGHRHLAELQQ